MDKVSGQVDYDDLLRRGIVTARAGEGVRDVDALAAQILELPDWDRRRMAAVLARAFSALSVPGRIGDIDGVAADLAEAMFDAAHEGCDDENGCTGGGRPYYDEYVATVLVPVLREHAVPVPVA